MQLLKITSIPIKYRIKIEQAKLKISQAGAENSAQNEKPKSTVNTSPIRRDKFNRDDANRQQTLDLRSLATQISSQNIADAEIRNNTENSFTVSDIVNKKLFKNSEERVIFMPSTGPQVSFDSNNLNLEYTPSNLDISWKMDPAQLDFIPGSFKIDVEQYPEIKIEYLGKPMYIPPSADPEYNEDEE